MSKKTKNGFTVIEILLATAMFAVIIPALVAGLSNLKVLNNRARDLALVNMLAHNKVELLRSAGYNSVPLGTVDFTSELPSTLASPKSATYTVTINLNGIKNISVDISYKDYQKTKTVNYKSLITEVGVGQ